MTETGTSDRLLDESYVPLDPSTIPSTITSAPDTTKQLWLFQVPLDFEIGRQVTWKLNSNNTSHKATTTDSSNIDSINANCLIDGVRYQLTSEEDLPSAKLFALAPGSSGGNGPIPIVKKLIISRKTDAQRICFGIEEQEEEEEEVGGDDDDNGDGEEEKEKEEEDKEKSKKRRKEKEDGNGGDRKKRKKRKSKSNK